MNNDGDANDTGNPTAIQNAENNVPEANCEAPEKDGFSEAAKDGKPKRKSSVKKIAASLGIVTIISIIGIAFDVTGHLVDWFQKKFPSYQMETVEELYRLGKVDEILGNNEKLSIYHNDPPSPSDSSYFGGTMYYILFSNRSDVDRTITKFTVNASDIIKNTSPVLLTDTFVKDNQLITSLYNSGWGAATQVLIETHSNDQTLANMLGSEVSIGKIDKVDPGQSLESVCIDYKNLNLDFLTTESITVNPTIFYTYFESNVKREISFVPPVFIDRTKLDYPPDYNDGKGGGGPGDNYAIIIPVENKQFSYTYDCYQVIPAHQTVKLPIFIIPAKSCSLSLSFDFLLENKEVIKSKIFKDLNFVISYYDETDEKNILDGLSIDWNSLSNDTNMYFPFGSTNKVVDPESLDRME